MMAQQDGSPSVEVLVKLGREALDGGRVEEAFKLFCRAQEADPYCFAAYLGKGEAAGRSSTVDEMRFMDMAMSYSEAATLGLRRGIGGDIRLQAAIQMKADIMALWDRCLEGFRKSAADEGSWAKLVGQAKEILWAGEMAWRFDRADEALLRWLLAIARSMLQGFPRTTDDGGPIEFRLSTEDVAHFREQKEKITYRIRRMDPAYETPES